jgi:transposase
MAKREEGTKPEKPTRSNLPYVYLALLPKGSHRRRAAIKKIAEIEGVSVSAVNRRLNRFERTGQAYAVRTPKRDIPWTRNRDKVEKAIAMKKRGMKTKNIAKKLGVYVGTVYVWFKKAREEGTL